MTIFVVAAPFDNLHQNIPRQKLAETAEACGGAFDLDFESFEPFAFAAPNDSNVSNGSNDPNGRPYQGL